MSYISGFAWFFMKFIIFLLGVWCIKAVLPNVRYDQLVRLSFKIFVPVMGIFFLFYSVIKIMMVGGMGV